MRWRNGTAQQLFSHWGGFPGKRSALAFQKIPILSLAETKVQVSLPPPSACLGCFYLRLMACGAGLRAAGAFRPPDLPVQLYWYELSYTSCFPAWMLGSRGESKPLRVLAVVTRGFGGFWGAVRHPLWEKPGVCSHLCWGWRGWPQTVGIDTETGLGECQPLQKAWAMAQKVPVSFAAALACKAPISSPSQAMVCDLQSLSHKVQDIQFITHCKEF